MTRTILLPIVLLFVGLLAFGLIQYFSRKNNEKEWRGEKKELEAEIIAQNEYILLLENRVQEKKWH